MYSVSLLSPADVVSAQSFVSALDRFGVLEYTSDVERIQRDAAEKTPIHSPKHILAKTCGGHAEEFVKHLDIQEEDALAALNISFIAETTHATPLQPSAAEKFSAHMQNLALILARHGITIDRLPSAKQIFTRDGSGILNDHSGKAVIESNIGYVSNELEGERLEAVALHEGIHLASAAMFCCKRHHHHNWRDLDDNTVTIRSGLHLGGLFRRLNEGLTDVLTTTLLGRGTDSAYHIWGPDGENSTITKRLLMINNYYRLRDEKFPMRITGDEFDWVTGAGQFVLRAYFAHDLTFYGLLYHAFKRSKKKSFASMAEDNRSGIDISREKEEQVIKELLKELHDTRT